MKIGIVGGGISGLYCANLLEERGHDVTIFENNKWGGDIQTTIIDGKCYPISTLVVHDDHSLLKEQMKKYGLDDYNADYVRYHKSELSMQNLIITYIGLILVGLYGTHKKSKVCMGLLVFLIIIILMVLMPGANVVNTYYHKKYVYPVALSYGAVQNYKYYKDVYAPTFDLMKNINMRHIWAFLTKSYFVIAKNCGFYRLVQKLMQNKNINYIHGNIEKIERHPNAKIHTSDASHLINRIYDFDKIIIACGYKCYKNTLPMSNIENKYLSNAQTFKFYSTIIKINSTNDLEKICSKNDILGYYFLGKNVLMLTSHKPIICNKYIKCKSYEWDMPLSLNDSKKQSLNKKGKNVLFIGKEITFNGVDYCIRYAKHVCDNFI